MNDHYHVTIALSKSGYKAIRKIADCKDFTIDIEVHGTGIENEETELTIRKHILSLMCAVRDMK